MRSGVLALVAIASAAMPPDGAIVYTAGGADTK